jgi:hypothetical protein
LAHIVPEANMIRPANLPLIVSIVGFANTVDLLISPVGIRYRQDNTAHQPLIFERKQIEINPHLLG